MMHRFTYKRPSTFVFAQTQTQTKESVNGEIAKYNTHTRTAEYDGQVLKIAECDKNKCAHYSIKEKDIEHFIKKGTNLGLMQRLKKNHLSRRARTRLRRVKKPRKATRKNRNRNKNRNK